MRSHLSKPRFHDTMPIVFSLVDFSPFGFVLKPVWSIHMFFNMIMSDSCEKSSFKTSTSRHHAYRVLHSRFPPFGFVLKLVWSIHMFFNMIMSDSCWKPFSLRASGGIGGPGPPRESLEGNFSMTSSHILAWTPPECEREGCPRQNVWWRRRKTRSICTVERGGAPRQNSLVRPDAL